MQTMRNMTVRRWTVLAALVVAAGAWAAPAAAQDEGAAPLSPTEVQRLLDAYVLVQAQDAVELTDAQYPQFVTKLRTLQDARRRNERLRMQLINELNRLSSGRGAAERREPTIRERLTALDELEVSAAAELRQARRELADTLDLRQQARLRVFEERVEQQKLQLLVQARRRQARPQPQRQQPPSGP